MNRIEIVGLFNALKKLLDLNAVDEAKDVIQSVLDEAMTKKAKKDGSGDDD